MGPYFRFLARPDIRIIDIALLGVHENAPHQVYPLTVSACTGVGNNWVKEGGRAAGTPPLRVSTLTDTSTGVGRGLVLSFRAGACETRHLIARSVSGTFLDTVLFQLAAECFAIEPQDAGGLRAVATGSFYHVQDVATLYGVKGQQIERVLTGDHKL